MPQINLLILGHALPATLTAAPDLARPYQPRIIEEDERRLTVLRAALDRVQLRVFHNPTTGHN